jgi:hypothetical protein
VCISLLGAARFAASLTPALWQAEVRGRRVAPLDGHRLLRPRSRGAGERGARRPSRSW